MATILFTWELGGNLGHVTTIGPIARELRSRGHRVVAALRDLANAHFLGDVELLPACSHYVRQRATITYADLLANAGFADASLLAAHIAAWRNLMRLVQPDVVVCDHSPTALLAARCSGIPRATIGTGFCVPPNAHPLQRLIPGTSSRDTENHLLENINRFLRLEKVADLYDGINLLTTYPELDHFGARLDAEYFGAVDDSDAGAPPVWSQGDGPRVFAYLRPFPGLESLLASLRRRGHSTLAVVRNANIPGTTPHAVQLKTAFVKASLCICHASHGTTAASLMAGRPVLTFPTQSEQYLLGQAVERLGAGMIAQPERMEEALDRILNDPSFREAAEGFARNYRELVPAHQVVRIADRIETLRCRESPRAR